MADPIAEVLGVDNIVGVIQTIKPGLPPILPPEYYAINRTVTGDFVAFDSEAGERNVAPVVDRNSPSRHIVVDGMTQAALRMLTLKLNASINPNTMQNLRAPGGQTMQRNGQGEVARILGRLNKRIDNTRLAASHMMLLGGGLIYIDSNGDLLTSSTGQTITVDAGLPASNIDQGLQMDGTTAIIQASWATAATDILGEMETLLNTALERTGYPIETAVYGANILGYFTGNTAIQNILDSHASLAAAFSNLAVPNGFLGIKNWIRGSGAFWVNAAGTATQFVGDDVICFLPPADGSWLENVEGSFMVPNGPEVYGSLVDANNSFIEVTGKFGYAGKTLDPPGATMYAGDTFLPYIKVPNAVYRLDVTP